MNVPIYIILSLVAALGFALSQVVNKLASKHSVDNPNSIMAFFMLSSLSFAIILFPFVKKTLPNFEVFIPVSIAVLTFLIGYYLFFNGIFKTDASSFAPLFQLQAVFVAILAYLFLDERFPVQNYLWIFLIIIGAILVSLDEKMSLKSFLHRGVAFIVGMQIFHSVSNLFVGFSLKQLDPVQLLFWEFVTIGILFLPFVLVAKPKLSYKPRRIAPIFVASYFANIGAIFFFKAFQENLTISSTIGLLSSPIVLGITVLASRFRPELLEHHTKKVYIIRSIGVLLILIGAIKLSLG